MLEVLSEPMALYSLTCLLRFALVIYTPMGWIEKGTSAAFENKPIEGLFFIDGDLMARRIGYDPLRGQKYPTIIFPSGMQCDLWESSDPNNAIVHIFGEMDLLLNASRDEAFTRAEDIAEQVGYVVLSVGDDTIEAFGGDEERVRLIYDVNQQRLRDVRPISRAEVPVQPKPELLDAKSRNALPPLRSAEHLGLDAQAQVKFFMPDGSWTWYASEGAPMDEDGRINTDKEKVDFLFFGLVNGWELEFGYFTLSELQEVRGALGLPIERDRYFQPTTLRELQAMHEQQRRQPGGGGGGEGPQESDVDHILILKDELAGKQHRQDPAPSVSSTPRTAAPTHEQPNADLPVPVSWLTKEDLLLARPDLKDKIAALGSADLAHLADKVSDGVQETYWLALGIVLDTYVAGDQNQSNI